MNLLIVADKAESKVYESIAKTAPNTAVLGAVTKIESDFISVLRDKYNPHAILIDTDITVAGSNIQAIIEEIAQDCPYIKTLVLTSEDDSYNYPVDCIVQGQVSNIKLKEVLTCLANGSDFTELDASEQDEPTGLRSTHRIKLDNRELDKLSGAQKSKRHFGFPAIHINPIILAGAAAGVLVLVVVFLIVMKGLSGAGQAATPDEAETTSALFLFETQPSVEPTTDDGIYPTLPNESYMTAAVPTTNIPPTIAPEPTVAPYTAPTIAHSEEKPTVTQEAPRAGGSSSSGGNSGGNSSINNGNNSGGSANSSHNSQPSSQSYGGEPVVSYDSNDRYSNSGGNAVSSVKLNYSSKTLQVDDTLQLTATVSPSTANQTVSWSSSNNAVASVSNGRITAKKVGKATVTATAGNGKTAACEVIVKQKEQTDNVHLSAAEYHINIGQTITVTLYGANNVNWSVSNFSPVTITPKKNTLTVKARRKGKTQIFAKNNTTGKTYISDIFVE